MDFWFFPKLKTVLKEKHFDTITDIERAAEKASRKVLNNCITSQGEYFEGG